MATIGTIALTLADWAKRVDPDGKIDKIVDILSETNEILDDAIWVEGNLPTGHRTTVRTGLPTAAWRQLNYGIQPSKSTTKQVTDSCGMLEAYAEVDKDLADLNGNTSAFRTSEDTAFLEAMNQEMADTLFYGNTDTDPEKFLGLAPRFDDLAAENGGQIVNAGGSGSDNTSIWVVSWHDQTCHLTFPKGSKAGLTHTNIGEVTLEDSAGGRFQGYRSHYQWKVGLVLRDWRFVSRVANIDVSNLSGAGGTGYAGPDLVNLLIDGINKLENTRRGKIAIYCNKTVKTALDKIAANKSNVNLTIDTVGGKPQTQFWGYPIRRCDSILNAEAAVA